MGGFRRNDVYDFHLEAEDLVFPAHWTKKDINHWSGLRAKRIDLIVKQDNRHIIYEITPKLSKAAIGGVLGYRDMYLKQVKPGVPVAVGIICEMDDPMYHKTLEKYNIELKIV